MSSIIVIVMLIVAGVFGCEFLKIWWRETAWRRSLKRESWQAHSRDSW